MKLLDKLDALERKAAPPPWSAHLGRAYGGRFRAASLLWEAASAEQRDASFYLAAAARNALPLLTRLIRAQEALIDETNCVEVADRLSRGHGPSVLGEYHAALAAVEKARGR